MKDKTTKKAVIYTSEVKKEIERNTQRHTMTDEFLWGEETSPLLSPSSLIEIAKDCCKGKLCEDQDCKCSASKLIHKKEEKICLCKNYEGDVINCQIHPLVPECPRCHCVNAAKEKNGVSPEVKTYVCKICGIWFYRNIVTGDYV